MVQGSKFKGLAYLGLACVFSFLLGFGVVVQTDYVVSWKNQKEFWSRLIALTPDLDEGTVVLVDLEGLKDFRQIGANTWNLPRILPQIFDFPSTWQTPPRVFRLLPGWKDKILVGTDQLQLNAHTTISPPSLHQIVDSSKAILVTSQGHILLREDPSLILSGIEVGLKGPIIKPQASFKHQILYQFLIDPLKTSQSKPQVMQTCGSVHCSPSFPKTRIS